MTSETIGPVAVGTELPSISFGPVSRTMLALYAGASGDHNPIHIDIDMAREAGMPDVFAHGMLSYGVLARVASNWAGPDRLRSFSAKFVSMTQVHERVTCSGSVVERFEENGEARIRIAMEARTDEGRVTLSGEALVAI